MRARTGAVLFLALVAAAAALRVAFWSRDGGAYLPTVEPQEGYYEQGVGWLSHGVLSSGLTGADPELWRGPVFPAFLALTEVPFPDPWVSHPRLAQALLSALAVAFAFWLGGLLGGRVAAWAAAVLLAFDAGQILSAGSLNVHAFYGLALLALAGAAALWAGNPALPAGLALGAALGGTLLIRSTHFLAVPLVLALGAFRQDGFARAARRMLWPVLALLAVLTPWTLRNAVFFKTFQPLDSYSGAVNLYAASRGKIQTFTVEDAVELAAEDDPEIRSLYSANRTQVFPRLLSLSVRRIAARPMDYLRGVALRWKTLYFPWIPAIVIALFAALRRRSRPAWSAFAVLSSLSAYSLIAVQSSYADCLRPLAAVLCGLAVSELPWPSFRRSKLPDAESRAARPLALAFAGFFSLVFVASLVLLAREAALAGPWSARRVEGSPAVFAARGPGAESLLVALARQDKTGVEWQRLGVYRDMTGDSAAACSAFERAGRAPEFASSVRPFLIDCLLSTGRLSQARRAADAAVSSARGAGDLSEALVARSRVERAAHQDAAASADLKRAEALSPNDPRIQRGAVAADLAAGRRAPAESRLRRALASPLLKPADRADFRVALAALLWKKKDAEADAQFASALMDDAAHACRAPDGLADPASLPSSYFDRCLARFPGDVRLLADRGVALWTEGRKEDAVSSLKAALAGDPGDLSAALSLSAALGDVQAAREVLASALEASREPARSPLRLDAEKALGATHSSSRR